MFESSLGHTIGQLSYQIINQSINVLIYDFTLVNGNGKHIIQWNLDIEKSQEPGKMGSLKVRFRYIGFLFHIKGAKNIFVIPRSSL